ncbi:hypothetical protein HDU87_001911 [Geranomyces variabilis]|uniref:Hcy-binding domain-containing protein n=1 Tax=Geranomyces variabilis TaxID=109894 RepID=A0AAD5TC32_9FUNG|nr:hypothetical protein HDU87_001911 [Geranomyces variabilis]
MADNLFSRGRRRPLVLDGGLATELETAHAKDLSGSLWSARILLDDPDSILAVHRAYLAAGAQIITTATYQASVAGFHRELALTPSEAAALMHSSLRLAEDAITAHVAADAATTQRVEEEEEEEAFPPAIAVSLGCFGATLADGSEYTGVYPPYADEDYLCEFHVARALAVLNGDSGGRGTPPPPTMTTTTTTPPNSMQNPLLLLHLLLFETIPSLLEARAIARALAHPALSVYPAGVAFSCGTATTVRCGATLRECIDALLLLRRPSADDDDDASSASSSAAAAAPPPPPPRAPLAMVGVNCTQPHLCASLVRIAAAAVAEAAAASSAVSAKSHSSGGKKPPTTLVVCYPNSGEVYNPVTKTWSGPGGGNGEAGPDAWWAGWCKEWLAAGADVIGGCCRTRPRHIEAIARLKKNAMKEKGLLHVQP